MCTGVNIYTNHQNSYLFQDGTLTTAVEIPPLKEADMLDGGNPKAEYTVGSWAGKGSLII